MSLSQKYITLINIPFDLGAKTPGACMGYVALQSAAEQAQSAYFKNYQTKTISINSTPCPSQTKHLHAKNIVSIVSIYEKLSTQISYTLTQEKNFPIVISGDHSIAGGTIAGIKNAYPNKRLGVIWIDAHADIHSPYTTPSGNVHGMPLATALAIDNKPNAINAPNKETLALWEKLKTIGNIAPKIMPQDLIYMCVREPEEDFLRAQYGIKNFTVDNIRHYGPKFIARQALRMLNKCDLIYVSFDIDSLDPTISQGTGTPVSHGITNCEAQNLIVELAKSPKICCFEITEINPTLDLQNATAKHAFSILEAKTKQLEKRIKKRNRFIPVTPKPNFENNIPVIVTT